MADWTDLSDKKDELFAEAESLFEEGKWIACTRPYNDYLRVVHKDESVAPAVKAAAYRRLGFAYGKMHSYETALGHFRTALEFSPDDAETYSDRGLVYAKKGDLNLAFADFGKALELDPNCAGAYNNRGFAHMEKKNFNLAIAACNKALELDPKLVAAYDNRGFAYMKTEDFDRAIADFSSALQIRPNDSDLLNIRAEAYIEKGDYESAISDYDEVLDKDPANKTARMNRDFAIYKEAQKISDKRQEQRIEKVLKRQKKEFESQIEAKVNAYDINLLRIEEYETRRKEFQDEAKEVGGNIRKWFRVLWLVAAGIFALVLCGIVYIVEKPAEIWLIFPLITAAGMCSFPFIWYIRTLKQQESRLMALSQDAYTKGILANLINVNIGPENRKELLHKFFDHHTERGSAQLIVDLENNGKSESGAVNVLIKYLKDNMSGKN